MDGLHVVYGTGTIGLALVEELAANGASVRAVNRSGHASRGIGIRHIYGDDLDTARAG
jgi:nucleoside-diphosphate-sugar epimerase